MLAAVVAASLAAASLSEAMVSQAPANEPECRISLAKVTSPPRFEDYPAERSSIEQNAPVRLSSKEARHYRTVLRQAAARKPDFAGHYVVAGLGCGAACSDPALIDARTGRVFFDSRIRDIGFPIAADDKPMLYRLDSRLLIVEGVPNERWGNLDSREGIYFFEWTGAKFRLIRFVPKAQACVPEA